MRNMPTNRKPWIDIVAEQRVALWIVGLHVAFAEWLLNHSKPRHHLTVFLHARPTLPVPDGRRCLGFYTPRDRVIGLACRLQLPRRNTSKTVHIRMLLDDFAHEYVHYERHRDNKAQNHRGLQQRVDTLCVRFEKDFFEATT